ncbi:MAG TPA: glycerol-3-phosphate 1-O-acyltransferase PlsY [Gaiellaceae bacterium]|nr:glycerol-3-phosphate 1-O-acyltransferase PlsY [Gaiellaceae bacterium]
MGHDRGLGPEVRDHDVGTLLLILAGYVAGSIPTGYWLVRAVKHVDIRSIGSGNIGGTNVWRVYGWRLGLPVIFVDTAKGFVPALVGTLTISHLAGVLAGGAAMLGHWRPLFLRWQRGGKAVATCGGAFLGVAPIVGGIGAAIWIVAFLLFRYASVASMVSACSLPLIAVALGEPWPVIVFAAAAAVAVVVLHRANIARLRAGTENRFRLRRPARA